MHGHRRPTNADMTVAGYTDHGSQHRSYRPSSGRQRRLKEQIRRGWRELLSRPSMGCHERHLALPPQE
jgi:hypothetical protein